MISISPYTRKLFFTDPPEDVYVSTKVVNVVEGQAPNPVKCHGKGHPNLTYKWKKNSTAEPKEYGEELRLGPMIRSDSGTYICEASNKHGTENAVVYFNVMCKYNYLLVICITWNKHGVLIFD